MFFGVVSQHLKSARQAAEADLGLGAAKIVQWKCVERRKLVARRWKDVTKLFQAPFKPDHFSNDSEDVVISIHDLAADTVAVKQDCLSDLNNWNQASCQDQRIHDLHSVT